MKKTETKEKRSFGNVMPQALEAEGAVLGAILSFGAAYDEVPFLTPEMFYDPRHRLVFEAIVTLKKKDSVVDIITVHQQVAAMGKADEVSAFFIVGLTQAVASKAHVVEHALIVKDKYLQREAINLSLTMRSEAADDVNDIGDVLFNTGKAIENLQETLVGQHEAQSYHDISRLFYEDLQKRMKKHNQGDQTGVNTGLTELNRITSGWQGSELVILAARPAMGKTAMALHFAQAAATSGVPVVIFSLEMSKISLYNRSILSQTDSIDPANLKSGNLSNELIDIDKSVAQLCKLPIYVDDNSNVNMAYIRSACRLLHKRNRCGMVIIDYLQLITPEKERNGNREQEIAAMSRQAKLIAKELDIPVILLSQLNRDVEKRTDKRPQLSDLRESGAIEQDADMVLFIHRPSYYGTDITDPQGNVVNAGELIISKYRNGAIGRVKFTYNDTLTRIEDF